MERGTVGKQWEFQSTAYQTSMLDFLIHQTLSAICEQSLK